MFGEDRNDHGTGTGKSLRPDTAECRYDIKGDASQTIPIAHIFATFRVIMDTRHDQILT